MFNIINTWEALLSILLITQIVILAVGTFEYIQLKRRFIYIINKLMNCDEIIDQLLIQDVPATTEADKEPAPEIDQKRARLAAIISGGRAQHYLGKQVTMQQLDEMKISEVEKLYHRYEIRLGSDMTKTIGSAALQMYTLVAGTFLPIPPENRPKLMFDLEEDPFVGHALTTVCCELYHRYGMYLAPLSAVLTTVKHCEFKDKNNYIYKDDVDTDRRDDSDGACPSDEATTERP